MMGGMAGMIGTPWGWGLLLLLVVGVLLLLVGSGSLSGGSLARGLPMMAV
jgi:hypothetical protein